MIHFGIRKNYSRKEPNSIIATNTDINRPYKEVAIIQTTGRPKDEKEAFRLMRKQLATLGVDAVIKFELWRIVTTKEWSFFLTSP